ncbi:orotidine-5 -phosphate decarboxylase [Colletotrichum kahawae]|uniref:Orotidine-5 -phosphate decarboxylase n=1 Tax=Colletotrichum kahawae TaxID=34407 RepID=A0AAD9Y690_COLKA|nr:orotidine-5 -phosphate decarboxylase [Colletotrichum kahawae]
MLKINHDTVPDWNFDRETEPAHIVEWAHVVSYNMTAGKDTLHALAEEAVRWWGRRHYRVRTLITANIDPAYPFQDDNKFCCREPDGLSTVDCLVNAEVLNRRASHNGGIRLVTTLSQHFEPAPLLHSRCDEPRARASVCTGTEDSLHRGVLIQVLASGNQELEMGSCTQACTTAAGQYKISIMGFVFQNNLDTETGKALSELRSAHSQREKENGDYVVPVMLKDGSLRNESVGFVDILGARIAIVDHRTLKGGNLEVDIDICRRRFWETQLSQTTNQFVSTTT